ncbi:pilus assembly protein TadB [Paenibacillus dendritiformis]|uniref:type II secretion system F family protein n=1 Tax=Paenibacillus dendritiformis TaxID=130049 RepID=UPI00105A74C7|nr:type II secretion system F family protein [Paenibacillus dendritiformis]TDL57884.1 pilus assembly protein TadB [Paenibacillus dendritiformis]
MGKQPEAAEQRLPQYCEYILSRREKVAALSSGAAVMATVGYLFYHHWLGMLLLAAAGLRYTRIRRHTLLARKRARLAQQFKQALYSLSSSLSAGRSMENAFREAIADLKLLYPGTEVEMERELRIIAMRMENGEPLEQAVIDLSRRAAQEDISNFADVLVTCKRTGGDLIEVVRRTSSVIGEKMDIKQEIDVLVAQKRLEMKVMMAAPFLFLAFLNLASPDFMAALYEGVGRVIATVALLLLLLGAWLIHKLMDIRV